MTASGPATQVPLSAEQVRQFIADGYLVLKPDLPSELHECIRRRLDESIPDRTSNPGNNILPLVPEMRHVLGSPEVRGALQSLLGPGYLQNPHRFCHVEEPSKDPGCDRSNIEWRAKLSSNCHQDSYTPLARPRHHHLRYARVMYYPQDTPKAIGPTHVIPGTHLNSILSDVERARPLPIMGEAGTVSLTHFDLGHAAGINLSGQRRFMVKFIYQRASQPTADGWADAEHRWRNPAYHGGERLSLVWSHLWDWLRGAPNRYDSLHGGALSRGVATQGQSVPRLARAIDRDQPCAKQVAATEALAALGKEAEQAIPALIAVLNRRPDPVRVSATYALGAIGAPAITPLIDSLRDSGAAAPMLLRRMVPRHRDHGSLEKALQLDDAAYALSAIGAQTVPALIELLEHGEEWERLNAAFALGEMDQHAGEAVPSLIRALEDQSHLLVRTAADALGFIGSDEAAEPLGALFHVHRPGWDEEVVRGWSVCDQVRVNAATALARLGRGAAEAETDLVHALDDSCGQIATYAMEALRRIGSPIALDAMMSLLTSERWDPSVTTLNEF